MTLRRLLLFASVGSIALAAMIGVFAFLMPEMNDSVGRVLGSVAMFGAASLLAMLLAFAREKRSRGVARLLIDGTLLCVAVTYCGWLTLVWEQSLFGHGMEDTLARVFGVLTSVCAAGTFAAIVTTPPALQPTKALQVIATAGAGAAVVIFSVSIITDDFDELHGRSLGIATILALASGVISLILWWAIPTQRVKPETVPTGAVFSFAFLCPRCAAVRPRVLGDEACPECGLRAKVEIDEPRCACGYSILGLTTPACPECGRELAGDERWAMAGRAEDQGGQSSPSISSTDDPAGSRT